MQKYHQKLQLKSVHLKTALLEVNVIDTWLVLDLDGTIVFYIQ